MNRLTQGDYGTYSGSTWTNTANYDLPSVTYDANGNITGMNCKNSAGSDRENLAYTYSGGGNQLTSVSGTYNSVTGRSGSFTYDNNGNAVSDGLRGVTTVSYFSEINLPKQYYKDAGNKVDYSYDALGAKWSKTATIAGTASTMSYYGQFVYKGSTLSRVLTTEGFYDLAAGNYHYYLKDHLGDNRITYYYSGSTPVIDQEVEYYPFGSMFAQNNLDKNTYLYNGKELNNEFFENYDYGARFYDAQIGRFHTIDALTEKFYFLTPYQYGSNNPVTNIDIDGLEGVPFNAPWLIMKWAEFKARAQEVGGAASRLLTGTSGSNMPSNTIPGTSLSNKLLAKWNDVGIVAEGVADVAGGAATVLGNIPGIETLVDVGGTTINLIEGDLEGAAPYAAGLLLPLSGKQLKAGGKGLEEIIDAAGSGTPRIKTTKQLRKEWEAIHGEAWPKDPSTGRNMVAHHEDALADRGVDAGNNITPKTNNEHMPVLVASVLASPSP